MKKILKWVLWAVFALSVVLAFYYLWSNGQDKEARYEIVPVELGGNISKELVLTGTITPRDEVAIKPQIAGIVSEIYVEAGQEVNLGDVIARISVIPDMRQGNSAMEQVRQAKLDYEHIKGVHKRNQELFDKGLLAEEAYQESKNNLLKSKARLEASEDNLQIIRKGVSKRSSKESSTLVRATIKGKVLSIPVKVGSSVIQANNFNEGTTIALLANMQDIIFTGSADETEVGKLAIDQKMELSVGALPNKHFKAVLEYISPKATAKNSGTSFEVRGALQELSREDIQLIRSGYSSNAKIITAEAKDVMTIPEACVIYRNDSTFVALVKGEEPLEVEDRAVQLGLSNGSRVAVLSGLEEGDKLRGNKIIEE